MSLYGAMFSGVSGLNAQSQALGMISDNISNVNTIGYKTAHASFSTLVTRQTGNNYAPGGVRSAPVYSIDRQGLLQASASNTDLAISGQGFFVMTEGSAPTASDTRFYSRAGQFAADSDGFLKAPSGFFLQGWRTDLAGVPTAANTSVLSSLEPIRVNSVSGSASPTTSVDIGLNLPASATLPASVANGSIQTTNVTLFDSLGVSNTVTLTWTKTAANAWTVAATAPTAGAIDESPNPLGGNLGYSVNVVFNGDGTPATFDGAATPPNLLLDTWASGANPSTIALNLGTQNVADGITQFSSTYSVSFINQDGTQFGNFFGVKVDEDGIVTALFDNGETQRIYKIPIATFPNPNGLDTRTGTTFTQSEKSGDFFLRSAGEANAGTIAPSALEASTSDLAEEFTSLIITQRAYAASTKIIQTADEMLDELIRIKR